MAILQLQHFGPSEAECELEQEGSGSDPWLRELGRQHTSSRRGGRLVLGLDLGHIATGTWHFKDRAGPEARLPREEFPSISLTRSGHDA